MNTSLELLRVLQASEHNPYSQLSVIDGARAVAFAEGQSAAPVFTEAEAQLYVEHLRGADQDGADYPATALVLGRFREFLIEIRKENNARD